MNSHYTYLLINFLTVFFPVVLSFDKRVQFYKSWTFIFPGLLLTGLSFLVWDYLFTVYDVWSFNPEYVVGTYFLNLPLEEILFFITVPFACIFIYACLNYYIKPDLLKGVSKGIVTALVLLSAAMLIFYHDRVYTLITFALLLVTGIYILVRRPLYIGRFLLAYIVSLLPFYIVNGILTGLPVVLYNDAQNIGVRAGTVPFEDHFYSFVMLYLNIAFFEYFRNRKGAGSE